MWLTPEELPGRNVLVFMDGQATLCVVAWAGAQACSVQPVDGSIPMIVRYNRIFPALSK